MAIQNPTSNFGWTLPVVGASIGTWGTLLNTILGDDGAGSLDSILKAIEDGSKAADWITSGAFHVDRIPSLPASKINSGTFGVDRIPSLPASKINSGTFADARIAESNVTQHQAALAIGAGQVNSGTFADARVAESNVTQHQAALSLSGDQVNLTAQGVAGASAGYAQIRVGGTLYAVPINELTE